MDSPRTHDLRCPACAAAMRAQRTLFDDRYGYPGRFELLRCDACGHCTLVAAMSAQELSDLYTRYYPRSGFDVEAWSPPAEEGVMRTWWRGLRASAFRWVPPHVRVLDIGCGFGESLGYHRARGCDAHGVEADANIVRVAERHGLNARHGLFDPSHYAPESFDVVTLDQVIEHVSQPASVLKGVHEVLKPGGMAVLSTPNAAGWGARLFGRRWIHWHAPYHLQFFTDESMSRCAAQAGLRLERRITVTNAAWLEFQWNHLVLFPAPGQPSRYWNASAQRSIGERLALKALRLADRLGVNILITRAMDALGRGDNAVYLLRKDAA
jgi:2-polyprenyl-3-methyl-5-hydroxy-6-metoxy-1,4-benzoquinol methylase